MLLTIFQVRSYRLPRVAPRSGRSREIVQVESLAIGKVRCTGTERALHGSTFAHLQPD